MKHEDYKQQFTAWAQLTEARLAEPVSYTHLTLPTTPYV